MRLLICTQVVDRNDPVLGFFHQWIEGFASRAEHVHVVCLKEGDHAEFKNVSIHSLGKERGRSRIKYILRFYRHVWSLRNDYDAVFVHMNQEYVLLAGILWRLLGKKVILWRNHKMGSVLTTLACRLATQVCYTSDASYVAAFANAVRMPVGIDTQMFAPGTPTPGSVLFLGRLDPVKRPEILFSAFEMLSDQGISFHADVYGEATNPESEHARSLVSRTQPFVERGVLTMHGPVKHDRTPAIYASHAVYVNLTPSGSFDKTIGEAMASGCIVVLVNEALRGIIPDAHLVQIDTASVARGISTALALSPEEIEQLVRTQRTHVETEHSFTSMIERVLALI
ncbi:MAG: glycosyltransferase family 4 protein [Minisyncoccia bacterium]